jgi:hypothetical protein
MKNVLTTRAWQQDIGCPISITLLSTSDVYHTLQEFCELLSAAQLMSQQAKSLKELTTSTYVV